MSSYNSFAQFYDSLTENVDYKVRSEYISNFFSKYGCGKNVLDLACGTGSIAKHLADMGYTLTMLDLSEDMLSVASAKNIPNATLLKGDMTGFELSDSVDCCVCSLDSINHLLSIGDVKRCFECVYNSLHKGGVFVFDVNTVYKHRNVLGDNAFIFDEEEFFLAWDNCCKDNDIVEIYLDFFVPDGDSYQRFSEQITERAYELDTIKKALTECGFKTIGIYDELTENPPEADSERVYFVAEKE
ncbi:MAG: class I SAM-dependent methyltransferase [Eubacterium sp.]|nr:class I SAM-dependent methyltransferase [Eubacterium sp.]